MAAANASAGYVAKMNLSAQDSAIGFDGASFTVIVQVMTYTLETKEKILLCGGKEVGFEHVQDPLGEIEAVVESQFYKVKRGNALSKIAKEFYGNANAYMGIFETNRPMLSHPNKIYPSKMLCIPAQ